MGCRTKLLPELYKLNKKSGFGLFLDFLLTILIFKLCAARTLKNSFLCSSEYFLENLAKKPFKC